MWGLSSQDLCEIARNSVLNCGFKEKLDWIDEKIGNFIEILFWISK